MKLQRTLQELSSILSRYPDYVPQPASKFDPDQPRGPDGCWISDSASGSGGKSGMRINDAVKHLNDNALPASNNECAIYVRRAIQAGGVPLEEPFPRYAKCYGPYLEKYKFEKLTPTPKPDDPHKEGDIAVFQPPPGHEPPYGHIQMYNGTQWVSDFKQPNGFWPGKDYREHKPHYEIYRP